MKKIELDNDRNRVIMRQEEGRYGIDDGFWDRQSV